MSNDSDFKNFIQRIREGDYDAASDLVRRYESLIRREVRLRLEDRRLSRLFDSMDVCQSVWGSFFLRASLGEYDLEAPEQLVGLLAKMARNKLASAARNATRQRRDHRRATSGSDNGFAGIAATDRTPSQQVSNRELLERFRQELSSEELQLADLRAEGLSWDEIAERLGGKAQARRMQLARAVERAAAQLKFEVGDDG